MEKRRLSAIMFTDIVGYTRKMGEDEVKMLRLLQDHNQMVEAAAGNNDGEIIKRIGDAFLISFDSAQNAVLCAIEIQQSHLGYNLGKDTADQVHLRIGIHLGDIVIREGDVFGDGVNVASRVEPLAHPGGICITRSVYDIVRKKMEIKAVELGPQALKNVDEAVEVFHLLSETVGIRELRKAKRLKRRQPNILLIAALTGILLAAVLILWRRDAFKPGGVEEIIRLVQNVEVPENRIAVLPLKNLTGSEDNRYICEGMSEDLIFRLSRVKDLYVYPLEDVLAIGVEFRTAQGVRKTLGVRYLVKGSLQRLSDSLIVQLVVIDSDDGSRVLSNRYSEIDEARLRVPEKAARDVLYRIIGAVSGEDEAVLAAYTSSSSLANDLYLQARQSQRKAVTWSDQQRVLELYESAIRLDSSFALAWAHLANAYAAIYGSWQNDTSWVVKANEHAEMAVSLAPDLPETYYSLGRALQKALQYDPAVAAYRQAIILRTDYRAPNIAMGDLYRLVGRYDEALTLYELSLEQCRAFGDRRGEATCLNKVGLIHENRDDCDRALEAYTASLAIFKEIGDRRGESGSLNNIGNIHEDKGDYDQALEFYSASLAIDRDDGNRRGEAVSLNNIGVIRENRLEYDEALESYTASFEILREIGDRGGESGSLVNLGNIHLSRGDVDEALENYTASLAIIVEIGNRQGEATSLNNIGLIHESRGDYDQALEFYTASLAIKREIGSRQGEAISLNSIGGIHELNGDYDQALKDYTSSLAISREIGSRRGEAIGTMNIGNIRQYQIDHEGALESYRTSLAIFKEMGDRTGEAGNLYNMGSIHQTRGEYSQALEQYSSGRTIYHEISDKYMEASILNSAGYIHLRLGDYQQAKGSYTEALSIYNDLELEPDQIRTKVNLAKLLFESGDTDSARDTLRSILDNPASNPDERFETDFYLGACEVKSGEVESGLARMSPALDSLLAGDNVEAATAACRVLGELLIDLGREGEARRELNRGRALADSLGMTGETELYDKILGGLE